MSDFILKIEVSREITEIVLKIVEPIAESLRGRLAYEIDVPEEDELMREIWVEELHEVLQEDCDVLLKLLKNKNFGEEEVQLKDSDMEAVIRACAAIRLKLHTRFLANMKDTDLESGEVDFMRLTPEERIHYSCYMFLAGMQNILIDLLDPESGDEESYM